MKTTVLTILCLTVLLTSCARTETEFVPAPVIPLPPEWLVDCDVPDIPVHMTYGDSLELNEKLLTVIENCNLDKDAIRKAEENRAGLESKALGIQGPPCQRMTWCAGDTARKNQPKV